MIDSLFTNLHTYCSERVQEFEQIPSDRKALLKELSLYFSPKFKKKVTPKAIVICTHNSRRSHLGQIWLAVAATFYNRGPIATYSGGTAATAFYPSAVKALQEAGLVITTQDSQLDNPRYMVQWQEGNTYSQVFSKKYDHPHNPSENFAAIMVCTDADEACPIVPGSDFRLALPYNDPKAFDGTDLEAAKYAERCADIAREMLFVMGFGEEPRSRRAEELA